MGNHAMRQNEQGLPWGLILLIVIFAIALAAIIRQWPSQSGGSPTAPKFGPPTPGASGPSD